MTIGVPIKLLIDVSEDSFNYIVLAQDVCSIK